MEHAAHTLCLLRYDNQCTGRYASAREIEKGVPHHFRVSEVPRQTGNHVDKYYYSPTGKKYRSVAEVKRSYVPLNIYIDGVRQGVFSFLPSSYVSDIARAFGSNYKGNAFERLKDIIEADQSVVKADQSVVTLNFFGRVQ